MKISVIIPVYNAEKYLGVCLESLLIQTFTDFEVILVNDCSTDSSIAVAESYLDKFGGRLKILHLKKIPVQAQFHGISVLNMHAANTFTL